MPTTHIPHLWQVGVYLRLSKEDARRESASIANQRAILLDYLNHEFPDPWTLTPTTAAPAPTTAALPFSPSSGM